MTEDLQHLWKRFQEETPGRRAQLYGYTMLRSIFPSPVVDLVLETPKTPNPSLYISEHYTSIFTDIAHQSLRSEIRTFFRHQLLAKRQHTEIKKVLATILRRQEKRMSRQEQRRPDLRSYLKDGAWSLIFLDLMEAQLWSNPTEAISVALPFLLAASLYRVEHVQTIYDLVSFFDDQIAFPQREWWSWVCHSFYLQDHILPLSHLVEYLHKTRELLQSNGFHLPLPFASFASDCVAALWWQEGDLFRDSDIDRALRCYHEALHLLYPEKDVPIHAAHLYCILSDMLTDSADLPTRVTLLENALKCDPHSFDAYMRLGHIYNEKEQYKQAILYYHYALESQEHHPVLWMELGVIHLFYKDYIRALDELNRAILFNPFDFRFYYNRAIVYTKLQQYSDALADYQKTLELDCTFVDAYVNRGNVYAMLNQPEQARQDYEEALRLHPLDMQALWLHEWISFGKRRISVQKAQRLQAIAEKDSSHYLAIVCQGIFLGTTQRDLKLASEALEKACEQEPDQWDPPFWLAMLFAYRNRMDLAHKALQKALILGLPVALLLPLYWLEKDRPEFFQLYARPVLQIYHL